MERPSAAATLARMGRFELGPLRFEVEHRPVPGEPEAGGPTLRVRDAARDREWLRFDCFDRGPHFHVDPAGRDEITRLDPQDDNVGWCVGELRRDLAAWLEKAGFEGRVEVADAELGRTLLEVERALRNPPPELDTLDPRLLQRRLSEKWETHPADVLPAWVAEMDFPLADPVRRVLARAVERHDVGYPIDPRRTGVLEAFAERMAERFGWSVEPAECALLTDVVQGLYVALGAFSEPGDGAVVPTPIYPPFLHAVSEMHRRMVECRAEAGSDRWEFDWSALRREAPPSTRMLLLCHPHNPTGRVLSDAELETLAELACERDWVVVSDEIHADLVYPEHRHRPFASLGPEVAKRTITLDSATKAFNIPGLRCAVAHFGSPGLRQRFDAWVPPHVRGGLGLLGLYATREAWRFGQPWLDAVMALLDRNRQRVLRFARSELPGARCFAPEATYLAWLDLRALDLPETPARLLLREGRVALSDGRFFGDGFEGFARLNFATSPAILEQVLERVGDTLSRHR